MAEQTLSRQPLYSARPTVRIDGTASEKVARLFSSLSMTEEEGGLSSLELHMDNLASYEDGTVDLAFEDERVVKLGSQISVYSGDEKGPREIFRGNVTGLEAVFEDEEAPSLVVLAEDALQRARLARHTRVHENTSIAELAKELASRLGLRPVITGFSEKLGPQAQLNESDLAFLRRLLSVHDGDIQVVGDELHISPRKDVKRGAVELELNGQLRRVRFIADLAHQVTEVTAGGWNAREGRRVSGSSSGRNLGPGQGRRGAELLRQALGERVEHLQGLSATTDAEAQALADAAFDARARRFVRVEATAEGNPTLRVGAHVTLKGLGRRYDNTYYITRACHRYDTVRGYETDFEAECAFLGAP